jgi:hypothetical protein
MEWYINKGGERSVGCGLKEKERSVGFFNPSQVSLKQNIGYCSSHFYQIKYRTPKLVLP